MATIEFISSFVEHNLVSNSYMNAYFGMSKDTKLIPNLIHNVGDNPIPIGKVYEQAAEEATSEILCFSHHDCIIRQPNWDQVVIKALEEFDVIGVAGTEYYEFTWPNWWNDFKNPEFLVGSVFHTDGKKEWESRYRIVTKPAEVCMIDGLLFFCNRKIFENKLFDHETFDGFHIYDQDFSMECHKAGIKMGVISMNVLHLSVGDMPPVWHYYKKKFKKKWSGYTVVGKKHEEKPKEEKKDE